MFSFISLFIFPLPCALQIAVSSKNNRCTKSNIFCCWLFSSYRDIIFPLGNVAFLFTTWVKWGGRTSKFQLGFHQVLGLASTKNFQYFTCYLRVSLLSLTVEEKFRSIEDKLYWGKTEPSCWPKLAPLTISFHLTESFYFTNCSLKQ